MARGRLPRLARLSLRAQPPPHERDVSRNHFQLDSVERGGGAASVGALPHYGADSAGALSAHIPVFGCEEARS
jgi:hypothetical protein